MILVSGATGHLGNVLVRELCRAGEKVRALVLPQEDMSSLAGLDIEVVEGNILDQAAMETVMKGVDTVFHMAALVDISHGMEAVLRRINVDGTKNMLKAAKNAGVRRFVYTSSIHAITRPPDGVTIDETLPFDPNNPAGDYDRTKAEASLAVLDACRDGMDAVIVCPTGVMGPYDFRRSEMGELILEWMRKKLSVIINGHFDFVDVRDIALGHILAAKKGRCGQTYILSGERIHLAEIRKIVKDAAHTPSPLIVIPYKLAFFGAYFAEIFYRITRTRPRFTRYSLETVVSNSVISYDKARKELGYQPRPLKECLQDTVAWWQENRLTIKPRLRLSNFEVVR